MQEMSHSTQGKSEIKSADLSLLIMKPLGAKWMIEAVEDTKLWQDVIINGFHSAGIMDAVKDLL